MSVPSTRKVLRSKIEQNASAGRKRVTIGISFQSVTLYCALRPVGFLSSANTGKDADATPLLALILSAAVLSAQNTVHVPSDQPSIQAGINAANSGDTVLVAPGTYYENIDFLGKAITLQSQSGAAVTTINGQNSGSVVTFALVRRRPRCSRDSPSQTAGHRPA